MHHPKPKGKTTMNKRLSEEETRPFEIKGPIPPSEGRGRWGKPRKIDKSKIVHPVIGTKLECELRTGTGVRRWTCQRPPNFGQHIRQSIWCSPALKRCMDRFYDEVDYRIYMSEKAEYERLCEEHRKFVEKQRARKARRNLLAKQRGKAVR